MTPLRFALFGAGFWARYQLAGWREVPGVECVGVFNRTRSRAEALAREFNIPHIDDNPERLLNAVRPDFVDVVTDVDTHATFVELAARCRLPVICQKPLAPTLARAEALARTCRAAGVPLLVNENWRWQAPIRALRDVLTSGVIGQPFRAQLDMISGFPVFANQPFLAELERFILTDLGAHLFDAARFLFGEPRSIHCRVHRTLPNIKGENVATAMLDVPGATVLVKLAYAENPLDRECFPETLAFVEGTLGSAELAPGCVLKVATRDGVLARRALPPAYSWANPAYAVVHASIVPCQANLAMHIRGEGVAETTVDDNLKTLRIVHAAYESAAGGRVVMLGDAS